MDGHPRAFRYVRGGRHPADAESFSSGQWHQRKRFLLTSAAVALVTGTVLLTGWWPDGHLDPVVAALVMAGAAVVATLTCVERLAPLWDRCGAVLGAGVLSVLVAASGGSESHYADFFLLIPVAAGFLLGRRDFVVACFATAAGAFAPLAYADVDAHFLSDSLGDLTLWIAVGVGVHWLTSELHLRLADLAQANEMREAFLRGISHELRTPLTVVQGVAQTLARRDGQLPEDQRRQLLAQLSRQSHRLGDLVLDLLDVDRLVRGGAVLDAEEHDLAALVSTVLVQMETNRHVIEPRLDRVAATVDAPKFGRIVENLVANAIRHTPAGTTIQVATHAEQGFAVLTVQDDGPGIPDEDKPRVFEPFVQGDHAAAAPSPGVGIGLALVARLTALHGGEVVLDDAPGGGTRFRVRLPGGGATAGGVAARTGAADPDAILT